MATKPDLSLRSMNNFTGTLNYHKVLETKVTDGVVYLMKNGYNWFVQDVIIDIRMIKGLRNKAFLVIKLHINKGKRKGENAVIKIYDDDKLIYTQKYSITDAKVDVKLYYIDRVLMLASEY